MAPTLAAATVYIEDRAPCISIEDARRQLGHVLSAQASDALTVAIVVTSRQEGYAGTLRVVTPAGDVVLERRVELKPEECASAAPLFAAMLDTFLQLLLRLTAPACRAE